MLPVDLDQQFTFESFVVGPANRLASAASKRAAESPGRSFNPLFIYSSSGLGKSHLLIAIANQAEQGHSPTRVLYQTMEGYLDDLAGALERGDRDTLRDSYRDLDILLIDDVQFITGHPEAQELLLGTLDALTASGGQVVLASDRPPGQIDELDARLLSRFSGGLIVDIAMPEYETRVAIVRKKVSDRNATLAQGTAELIARYPYENVRELQGALNRVLAVQEIEEREVPPDEVTKLLGLTAKQGESGEFASFVEELSETVATAVPDRDQWRGVIRRAMAQAETEGFSAQRLGRILQSQKPPEDPEAVVRQFRQELSRLKEVRSELDRIGNPWPEAAVELLTNPDRLREAEALLASARERHRPFPGLPPGPTLDALEGGFPPLAVRVSEQLALEERPEYNPLFIWSRTPGRVVQVQLATGRTAVAAQSDCRVAWISVAQFAEEFIEALSTGVAGAWRERWWTAELLLLHGVEHLGETERAEEEFFHLFEALKRTGARVYLAADRPPAEIEGIDSRLRSRFEGGLVLEIEPGETEDFQASIVPLDETLDVVLGGPWVPSPEQVVWNWPSMDDRVAEEPD